MVGRVVPHKNIEEAIALFAALRRHIPKATLTIVGEHPNQDYFHFLQRCAADLEMTQEDIIFTGKVDGTELRNRYRAASALLCVSLHEGFCIPVLEAMQFGVPVFVRTGNAAGEVAAGAGMLFEDDDVPAIARRVADTLASPPKLSAHIAAGKARAAALISRNSPAFWLTQLSALRVTRYLESASLT